MPTKFAIEPRTNAKPTQAQVTKRAKDLRKGFPADTGDQIYHELTITFSGLDREMARVAIDEAMEEGGLDNSDNVSGIKKMVMDQFEQDPKITVSSLRDKIKATFPSASETDIQQGFGEALRERNPNSKMFKEKGRGDKLFENTDEALEDLENALCTQCEKAQASKSPEADGMCADCATEFYKNHPVENSNGWPTSLKCSFIEPGIVRYADVGDVYVGKAVLEKMANSFIGKPVVNEDHRDVSPADFTKGTAQGIVNSVWFDPNDAMYHAGYQIWDQPTLKNIKTGYRVSCAYKVTKWGPGGIHNNVPYEREVLDGEYTHLAIVANPRYEGVKIYNDKGAKTMTLKWIKKLLGADGKEMENSVEIESSKSVVDVDGKEVPMDNLINAFKDQEAKREKELANQGPKDTDLIDIGGGKKVSVADLRNAYKAKNDEDEDEEKKKKAKEKEDMENAAKAKLQNDLKKDHEDGKHDGDKEKDNCAMCNDIKNARGRGHFERVDALNNNRGSDSDFTDELPERTNGFEEGTKRYGSEPKKK